MHIEKITVSNFRLLKNISIDLEKKLSLVIGKNNVGKTSLLKILKKFLTDNGTTFQFNDFNIGFRNEFKKLLESDEIEEVNYKPQGIFMRLVIRFEETDDIENISRILLTLDPENYYATLGFDYSLGYNDYIMMRRHFSDFKIKEKQKEKTNRTKDGKPYSPKDTLWFVERYFAKYFKPLKKSILTSKDGVIIESSFINIKEIPFFRLEDLLSFKYIEANRTVNNTEADKTLSYQTAKLYELIEDIDQQNENHEELDDQLREMDTDLNKHYKQLFEKVIESVKVFGGLYPADTEISIVSTLSHKNLLNGNTVVKYNHDDNQLPESFNGLGYMNLISMIFEIERIRQEFNRKSNEKPADINLLFIEEPEAHTHPQLQYIFIQNIKQLLELNISNKDGINRPLQSIISTHSSHIVCNCDFDDIKYMLLSEDGTSIVKNIKDLKKMLDEDKRAYAFLKQYLTLHRCELFFADKAVLIEGDTERILLPAMMTKLDREIKPSDNESPLLSQNISIIEVGAYSHIFIPLFDFINLKKLCIITDIDICEMKPNENGRNYPHRCKWESSKRIDLITSNASLKYFFNNENSIDVYYSFKPDSKILRFETSSGKYVPDINGKLRICFQIEEDGYRARSFEDSFFHVNKEILKNPDLKFDGLNEKELNDFRNENINFGVYELAEKGIKSKATLAADFLYAISACEGDNEL